MDFIYRREEHLLVSKVSVLKKRFMLSLKGQRKSPCSYFETPRADVDSEALTRRRAAVVVSCKVATRLKDYCLYSLKLSPMTAHL